MFEHDEKQFADVNQSQTEANVGQAAAVETAEKAQPVGPVAQDMAAPAAPEANGTAQAGEVNGTHEGAGGWRVEAGRKGAQRIHQLIEHGKLYEQEHGLKSGRQRLRQLIEEGKLYEREHGLTQERRRARGGRPKRLSSEQQLLGFLQSVLRLAKPRFRSQVARLIQLLESEKNN
jgi:hypothetical protein